MPRVKRGASHVKRRKNLLKRTKGYRWGRKNKIRLAHTAILKAGAHALRDRRKKKRVMRSLWITRLNAALAPHDLSYSVFIAKLKKANIELDRKILSELAAQHPKVFTAIVEQIR